MVLLVFLAVRGWQSRDAIRGPAPIIDARLINGEPVNLKQYHGKPVMVHFWATWCPICQFENESIQSISEDYPVLTVASWSDGAPVVQAYMREHGLDMPVIADENGQWARLYGVHGVPTSYIIDADGVVQFVETGYSTEIGLRMRLWWLEN